MTASRPSWQRYFLNVAAAVSTRGDCTRRQVGCVLVRDNRIVSTGYNGAPAGRPGCLSDGACPRGQRSTEDVPPGSSYDTGPGACIAIHAEANALLYADREDARGAVAYITDPPCDGCAKLLDGAGVAMAVWPGGFLVFES